MTPGRKPYFIFLLTLILFVVGAGQAFATHFRFGHITWQKTGPTTVQFTVTTAWRTSFYFPGVDPNSIGGTTMTRDIIPFQFGDGTTRQLRGTVIATLTDQNGENYFVVRETFFKNYSAAGNFIAEIQSCCRVSTLSNGRDRDFHVHTIVDLSGAQTGSSVSSITPQLQWPQGPHTVSLPIADPDSNNVTCTLANLSGANKAGYDFHPTAGGSQLTVTSDCFLSWDASYAADGSQWALQVHIGEGGINTDLDFIIEVNGQLALNDPPTCTLNGSTSNTIGIGKEFTISATGNDTEDSVLTMSAIIPNGAAMIPPTGTTANDPFNATMAFTPTTTGSHAATIVFTDSQNAQGSCNFSINVVNAPPVADAGADQTVDENDPVTLDGTSSTDPFGRQLTYQWTQVAGPPAVGFAGGNTANPTFTAPSVLADTIMTFELQVINDVLADTDTVDIVVRNTNRPPVADAGTDQTVEQTSAAGADMILDGSNSSDADSDPLTYNWTGPFGSATGVSPTVTLAPGTHTVMLVVNDGSEDSAPDAVQITVQDKTNPVITEPAGVSACNDPGQSTAVASFPDATATDNSESVTVNQVAGPTSDSPFPIGSTTVTWEAEDAAGNSAAASMTVTVSDCEAPVISTQDLIVESTGPTTPADITAVTSAVDNVAVVSLIPSNSGPFDLGATIVTWDACDAEGNCSKADQTVTVEDKTPPTITAPADITVNNDPGLATAVVSFADATATDNSGSATVTQTTGPVSGSAFPLGATTISWEAEDGSGNKTSASMTVTVIDNENPVITAPADLIVDTDAGVATAVVSFTLATATDNSGTATVTQTTGPASGSAFPLGSTTVTFEAIDPSGNTGEASFTVTVVDNEDPVVTAPAAINQEATGPQTTVTIGSSTATDNVGVTSLTSDAPATFPVGLTTVTWTAKDAAGNEGTATQTVTVVDTTPPAITAPADVEEDSTGLLTQVNLGAPTVSDLVSSAANITVTNDAPADGFPVASTTTVTWTAVDEAGNKATATQEVTINGFPLDISINKTKLKIHRGDGDKDKDRDKGKDKDRGPKDWLQIDGKLTEFSNGDGLNFATDPVTIKLNGFTWNLPPGSFKQKRGAFKYKGGRTGLTEVKVKRNGKFKLKVQRTDLSGLPFAAPIPFSVTVGNDFGETNVTFNTRRGKNDDDKGKDKDDDKKKKFKKVVKKKISKIKNKLRR